MKIKTIIFSLLAILAFSSISYAGNNADVDFKDATIKTWYDNLSQDEKTSKKIVIEELMDLDNKRSEWLGWYNSLSNKEKQAVDFDGYRSAIDSIIKNNNIAYIHRLKEAIDKNKEQIKIVKDLMTNYPKTVNKVKDKLEKLIDQSSKLIKESEELLLELEK
ncbi:hypothetical protein [Anaerococcus urinomassiliensis]|uniref:hypothetical protein n=1 Tax=Anaerococcus urinomassiliensis TaxID=1745712 RepID=UPI00093EB0AB|nr:hypothetical protein [Anaerococcus urinomassiliensis]